MATFVGAITPRSPVPIRTWMATAIVRQPSQLASAIAVFDWSSVPPRMNCRSKASRKTSEPSCVLVATAALSLGVGVGVGCGGGDASGAGDESGAGDVPGVVAGVAVVAVSSGDEAGVGVGVGVRVVPSPGTGA